MAKKASKRRTKPARKSGKAAAAETKIERMIHRLGVGTLQRCEAIETRVNAIVTRVVAAEARLDGLENMQLQRSELKTVDEPPRAADEDPNDVPPTQI